MKKVLTLKVFFLIPLGTFGQNYEPQILILSPNETIYDKKFEKELIQINNEMKKSSKATAQQEYIKTKEFNTKPENIRLMTLSEISFSEKMDFFRQTSYFAH